ncbi:hypothetical protein ABPG74_019419 [Tetrahymena malaccensis]
MEQCALQKKQSFLEKIDIFGISIAIRFNHLQNHNTRFGGLITLSILTIIFFQLVKVLTILFAQKIPQVIKQEDYVFQPEAFQIRPETFNIAMGLQDTNFSQFMDETIYKVKATQQSLNKIFNSTTNQYDQVWTYEELQLQPCQQNNFQIKEIQSYFLGLQYPTMYCFGVNEDKAFIEGEFSANIYKAISIEFLECIGEGCASNEKKEQYLNNPTLGIFFSNNIIQIQNKNNPQMPVGKNLYWLSGPSFQKFITLNLLNTYINSDFAFYGQSEQKQRIVQFSSSDEQVVPRVDNVMFKLNIVYEKNKNINYYRKYMKIDEAFSQLGGMFNALLTIGFLICSPFSRLEFNRKLLNSIFNIQGNQQDGYENKKIKSETCIQPPQNQNIVSKKVLNQQGKQVQNSENLIKNTRIKQSISGNLKNKNVQETIEDIKLMSFSDNNQIQVNKSIKDFFKTQFSELQIKFKDYIFNYFRYFKCFQTKKQKLITYGTNKLYNYLDVFYIINKMIEVEKLKHLLLNENQIKIFEYLPRPVLKINELDQNENDKDKKAQLLKKEKINVDKNENKLTTTNNQTSNTIKSEQKLEKYQFSYFGQEEKSQIEKAQDAQSAFNEIVNGKQMSILDEKIIQMLDIKLFNLFKENTFDFKKQQLEDGIENKNIVFSQKIISQAKFSNQSDLTNRDLNKGSFNKCEEITSQLQLVDDCRQSKEVLSQCFISNDDNTNQGLSESFQFEREKNQIVNNNFNFKYNPFSIKNLKYQQQSESKQNSFQVDKEKEIQQKNLFLNRTVPFQPQKSYKIEPKSLENEF